MGIRLAATVLAAILTWGAPSSASAQTPAPYAAWAKVLAANVSAGEVDYAGLKASGALLDQALAELAAQNPDSLPENARKAYYINAYNAWTVKLVVQHYPVASIRKIGPLLSTPWQIVFIRIGSRHTSLENIEHDILRREFGDPRIHFAINCASKSCPPLASRPYLPETLDEDLDRATREFLASPQGLVLNGDTLRVSALFDWFARDFGGKAGIFDFLERYAPPRMAERIRAGRDTLTLAFLPYDWNLNGLQPKRQDGDRP